MASKNKKKKNKLDTRNAFTKKNSKRTRLKRKNQILSCSEYQEIIIQQGNKKVVNIIKNKEKLSIYNNNEPKKGKYIEIKLAEL